MENTSTNNVNGGLIHMWSHHSSMSINQPPDPFTDGSRINPGSERLCQSLNNHLHPAINISFWRNVDKNDTFGGSERAWIINGGLMSPSKHMSRLPPCLVIPGLNIKTAYKRVLYWHPLIQLVTYFNSGFHRGLAPLRADWVFNLLASKLRSEHISHNGTHSSRRPLLSPWQLSGRQADKEIQCAHLGFVEKREKKQKCLSELVSGHITPHPPTSLDCFFCCQMKAAYLLPCLCRWGSSRVFPCYFSL